MELLHGVWLRDRNPRRTRLEKLDTCHQGPCLARQMAADPILAGLPQQHWHRLTLCREPRLTPTGLDFVQREVEAIAACRHPGWPNYAAGWPRDAAVFGLGDATK